MYRKDVAGDGLERSPAFFRPFLYLSNRPNYSFPL